MAIPLLKENALPAGRTWWRFVITTGKLLLVAGLLWVLYTQTVSRGQWAALLPLLKLRLIQGGWLLPLVALLLMPANWLFETLKWRRLLQRSQDLSLWAALKATLAGVAFSQLTPNRIGEYGGRILVSQPQWQWSMVVAALMGSMAQWVALLGGGMLGGACFFDNYQGWNTFHWGSAGLLATVGITTLTFIYFHMGRWVAWLGRRRLKRVWQSRILEKLAACARLDRTSLAAALGWATARYLVYTAQYALLLHFMEPAIPVSAAVAGVAVLYLAQTGIPLPPFATVLARSEMAIFLWKSFDPNPAALVAASLLLFIINLGLPALLGTAFIVKTNILKTIGYEITIDQK